MNRHILFEAALACFEKMVIHDVVHERRLMPWKLQDQQIFLHRPTLADIPDLTVPVGYVEQPNSDALLESWIGLLNSIFGGYSIEAVRPQLDSARWSVDRVKLVAEGDELVALSMAWREPALWPQSGFVFWVAVAKPHRGLGLGSFLLSRALQHMAREGLRDAVTYTQESRSPAVQMYLKLGFQPLLTGTVPDERSRWERTFDHLGKPELINTVRDDYNQIAKDKLTNSRIGQQSPGV